MTNKKSLGRGLQSLIPEVNMDKSGVRVEKIPMDKIKPRPGQPRKNFDEKALKDLADSIKEYGLLNPITLSKNDGHYEILAGERRYRASLINGEKTIDAIVKDYEERDIEVLSLIENVQREDLSAIEEANAYKKLQEAYKLTQDEIAQKMGKSRSYIANTIRLLKLSDEEKAALNKGEISPSQARSLLSVKDDKDRKTALDDYKNKKTVVREVEELSRKKTPNLDQLLFDDFEEKFMDKLGTKVAIEKEKDSYKVIIDCYSVEDIEKIYQRISHES
uniref:ParB/RepB/Spo0J family partition protein n=1 Tax=Anaerococcus mediterraneensis TaxID=1870984 RepID=UPI0009305B6D|nr:ParB/RepB/Spo0J family partition protein [Anaerococcus mediterraneensis]